MCSVREVRQGVQVHNSVSLGFIKNRCKGVFGEAIEVSIDHAHPLMFAYKVATAGFAEACLSYILFNVLMLFVDFAINVPVQRHLLTIPRRVLHQ